MKPGTFPLQTTRSTRQSGSWPVLLASLVLLSVNLLVASIYGTDLPAAGTSPARNKLRISGKATATQVAAAGGVLAADYGSFQIFKVSDAVRAQFAGQPDVENVSQQNVIALNTGALDTLSPEVAALRKPLAVRPGKQLHLVQFAGPVQPAWREALEVTGVQVITYIPQNAYLIYGDAAALASLQSWAATAEYVQWEGAFLDDYKIQRAARMVDARGLPQTPVTDLFAIQMVADSEANPATLALIESLKLEDPKERAYVLDYLDVVVRIAPDQLPLIAAQPEVISIQVYPQRKKKDERQDVIMSGNLSGDVPAAPGYLLFLASKGFTQAQFTLSGFAIDVSDSGIDNGTTTPGHFGLYLSGDPTLASRVIYNRMVGTPNSGSTLAGCDGHGNLNSHIMAGFNNQPDGFPHTDGNGFHYGLGVCPFVKVGSSVIFDPDAFTYPSYENLQSTAYHNGARISGNSWGASTAGDYDTDAQRYDALVRDAQPAGAPFATAGNQEMVIVFAAGNDGPDASSVGAPGTAKNVFTIGAAENVHSHADIVGGDDPAGTDGCMIDDTGADSANDIIDFSSRGPCTDGRKKPDIMAPGTHITGGVGQISPPPLPTTTGSAISCFSAGGVCGLNSSLFFPVNQQFYTTSSGTSHSTPAIAGACALLRQYFINQSLTPPSPAMTKAYLMNSARFMTGVGANDTLPSNNQGMGEVNFGTAFDGMSRVLRDELTADKFTATGQTRTYVGAVASSAAPFRVTLAWTDAPGNTSGNAYNNDLDLTVTVGGNTYKGNVFAGATSTTGGAADSKDNVESVFLPAGVSGNYSITVTAASINSDGVPNEAPVLDQDFALVIYNASGVVASFNATPTSGSSPLSVTFTDTSAGIITNRFWNFGNGTTSNTLATTVSTTYDTIGTNPVSLTVSGPSSVDTMTRSAYIVVTNLAPTIIPNGLALVVESCPNNSVDPGETVSLNVGLKNVGGAPTTNLAATLLAGSGIAGPSASQMYGNLSSGGGAASRLFSFTALGNCGTTDTATLQLKDGAANLGTVTFAFPLGNLVAALAENFDSVTKPALPAGWTTAATAVQQPWVSSDSQSDTAPNALFSPDPDGAGVNEIVTPVISSGNKLTFRHNFNLESGFDGGVLEIKIGAGSFTDILAAGGSFITNGYNRTISTRYGNPLGGRQAWSGTSNDFITTIVSLPPATATQPFQLKWRCGSDSSFDAPGWFIDTVNVTSLSCCTGPAILLKPRLAADGRMIFDLTGPAGFNYLIESSLDLFNWSSNSTISNVTGQVTFTEPGLPGNPMRTFRARRLP